MRVSDLDNEALTRLEIQILSIYGKEPPLDRDDNGALFDFDMVAPSANALRSVGECN